jgi:hypothetical protein
MDSSFSGCFEGGNELSFVNKARNVLAICATASLSNCPLELQSCVLLPVRLWFGVFRRISRR